VREREKEVKVVKFQCGYTGCHRGAGGVTFVSIVTRSTSSTASPTAAASTPPSPSPASPPPPTISAHLARIDLYESASQLELHFHVVWWCVVPESVASGAGVCVLHWESLMGGERMGRGREVGADLRGPMTKEFTRE
jgi:hypothetical protein